MVLIYKYAGVNVTAHGGNTLVSLSKLPVISVDCLKQSNYEGHFASS